MSKANLQARKPRDLKLCDSLQEAVRRSGLQDGMTISFHHAFRGGDLTLNQVMETLAAMGFRNLTLASSSLTDCHAPLVEHIRHGVVSRIYTSGLRGPLADAVSRGLLAEPVQIHSHGGRVNLIESGELKIDVAFLGVPACDEFGNANGYSGEACCGSLGYARVDAEAAGTVVLLTEQLVPYPHHPASLAQDRVDLIVQLERVGDADKIGADATRMTSNPRELLIARRAAEVIAGSGYFTEGFAANRHRRRLAGGDPVPGGQDARPRHSRRVRPRRHHLDHGGSARERADRQAAGRAELRSGGGDLAGAQPAPYRNQRQPVRQLQFQGRVGRSARRGGAERAGNRHRLQR